MYKGLKESGARPGQTVAIVGAGGGLGSIACQYAKAMGLRIIAVDAGDEKKEMTAKLGASKFVDFSKSSDVVKDVQAATEDGRSSGMILLSYSMLMSKQVLAHMQSCWSPSARSLSSKQLR